MSGLGVTGSRHGLTGPQRDFLCGGLEAYVRVFGAGDAHHGDCIGVDVQFAVLATEFGFRTIAHPPTKSRFRAYHKSDIILEPDGYYPRNRSIVRDVDHMFGFPRTDHFVETSGSWYTINYAIETAVEIVAVGQNGIPLDLATLMSAG